MVNIRKSRKKPGILPQHLTCIQALSRICQAKTDGAAIGSSEIIFQPGQTSGGEYFFDIGTAGSTTLLLQALLPPLLFSTRRTSTVTLRGGTHVPFSPSFDYIRDIFSPTLQTMGMDVQVSIEHYGFYPKGGGRIRAVISPAEDLRPLHLEKRGDLKKITITSGVGNLPLGIAERQCAAAIGLLKKHHIRAACRLISVGLYGKGTFVFLRADAEPAVAGFSSLGALGKKAEQVGEEAAREFLAYAASGAGMEPHLADQLILFLAFSGGESEFTTSRITAHLLTNLRITEQFTGIAYSVQGTTGMPGKVRISGKGLFRLDSRKTDK
jgi:RNA 3'-terminal phosphate cyclase (ATP)